jgi:hypothetical protein
MAIESEIAEIIKQDAELLKRIGLLTSIPGIGKLTAVIILAETNGFELIRNKKQLVSYAGLDVKEKTSGISVKGKPRISKEEIGMSVRPCTCHLWQPSERAGGLQLYSHALYQSMVLK